MWMGDWPPMGEASAALDELVHTLEHQCFLVSALVLWWTALLAI